MRGVSRRNKAPNWNFTQAELGGCVVWLAKIGQSSEGENSRTKAPVLGHYQSAISRTWESAHGKILMFNAAPELWSIPRSCLGHKRILCNQAKPICQVLSFPLGWQR